METKKLTQKEICTPMFTAALFIISKMWKKPMCPLMDKLIKKKKICIYIQYSAIKKYILPFVTT